ncbi:hypothetical protein B296_00037621, partial [Ensete ventricosum]
HTVNYSDTWRCLRAKGTASFVGFYHRGYFRHTKSGSLIGLCGSSLVLLRTLIVPNSKCTRVPRRFGPQRYEAGFDRFPEIPSPAPDYFPSRNAPVRLEMTVSLLVALRPLSPHTLTRTDT